MNRKILAIGLLTALAAIVYAQSSKPLTITGYLIDNACSDSSKDLAKSAKGHSTACALMMSCEKSGYSVVTDDGTRYKLTEKGDGMAAELLKNTKTERSVKVTAEGNYNGSELDITKLTEVAIKGE